MRYAAVLLALVACGEVDEAQPGTKSRPAYCESVREFSDALRECVRTAPDDATRDGCFREANVICGLE